MAHLTAEPCILMDKQWRIEPGIKWGWDHHKPQRTNSETSVTLQIPETLFQAANFFFMSLIHGVMYLISRFVDVLTALSFLLFFEILFCIWTYL